MTLDSFQKVVEYLKQYHNKKRNGKTSKQGPGEYAEHDKFLCIFQPKLRKTALLCNLNDKDFNLLLTSEFNDYRYLAIIILINKYKNASENKRKNIYEFYLKNTHNTRHWNIIDCSAPLIVGHYLYDKSKDILLTLSNSNDLWERRISIISTLYFIRKGDFEWSIKLAKLLLKDEHDLIHRAVGWVLREVGKRNEKLLIDFLNEHYKLMPRIMLRYAVKHLYEETRQHFVKL